LSVLTGRSANSAGSYANSAFATANSASSAAAGSYANSAFLAANTPSHVANSAASYANAAFSTANSAGGAASASSYANSGFQVANSASSYANSAFSTANSASSASASSYANSAFGHANSGFQFANTAANLALSFGSTTILEVTNSGTSAYRFSQYGVLDNPNVSTFSATTLGFKLNITGHPFHIRTGDNTADYNTGLVHVSTTGTLSYDLDAQGKVSGTLFWRIPHTSVGNYKYRCSAHPGAMIGEINIANTAGIYLAYNT
jgi:hypothetical protein